MELAENAFEAPSFRTQRLFHFLQKSQRRVFDEIGSVVKFDVSLPLKSVWESDNKPLSLYVGLVKALIVPDMEAAESAS